MHTRKLGNTAVDVPAIGLGCMGMSSVYGAADDAIYGTGLTDNELQRLEVIAPVGAAAGLRYPEPMMASLNG